MEKSFSFLIPIFSSIVILTCPSFSFAAFLYGGDPFFNDERASIGKQIFIDPDPISGAYTYEYPLTLPPGRNGLKPDLSLVYSTQSNSNISPFGYGWSINIPLIERIPRKGTDRLYNQDEIDNFFYSSLDGEIMASSTVPSTEDFGPRVENGSFRKYEFVNNLWWKVTDKNGLIYGFGISASARQNDPDVATSTFKWMLEKVQDRNGNYISYEYNKDSGQIYPSAITYTGNGSTDGIYEVSFSKEARDDVATSTISGFPVVSNYRIDEIQVKVDSTWVRKYELAYTTGNNGVRSLLDTITETGQGEDLSTFSLPVTNFDYQPQYNSASTTWTYDGDYSIPLNFVIFSGNNKIDGGVRLGDVNGDSYPDILRSLDGVKNVYIKNVDDTGWTEDENYYVPFSFVLNNKDMGVRLADVNGDGFIDILRSYSDGASTEYREVYINNADGTGWSESSASSTIWCAFSINGQDNGVRIFDVNADGLPDIVLARAESSGHVLINNGDGTGWTEDENYNVPTSFAGIQGGDMGTRITDVNGDGLPDLINSIGESERYVYINNGDGTGWTEDENYNIPFAFVTTSSDQGARFEDVNGDGLSDLVRAKDETKYVYINNGDGTGWTEDENYNIPIIFVGEIGGDAGVRFSDINGDGLADFLESINDNDYVYISSNVKSDILSKVTTHTGGTISINYTTTAISDNPLLPINFDIAESVVRNDGFGIIATTTYAYEGGEYYYNSEYDRKFAGFATTTITDPMGNVTKTFFHQGNDSQTSIGEYSDDVSKIGRAYRTEVYDDSNNLYQKTIDKWENSSLANSRDFVMKTRSVVSTYDGDVDHRDTAVEFTYDDTSGNLTEQTNYGEVTSSDDGTFTDSGSDKRTTAFTYAVHNTCYLPGFAETETVKNNGGSTVAEKRYYYDSLALGLVDKGNMTKEERLVGGSTYIDIERSYDSFGLMTQEKDPRNKTTTFSYFQDMFVGTTTDPLSHITETFRDLSSGKITSLINSNGWEFKTTYDALDRPVKEEIPDHLGTPSNLVTKTEYAYTDTVGSRKILQTDYLSSATSTETYTYLDGFDRVIQKRTEAEDTNTYIVTDTQYDKRGDVDKKSLPYFDTSSTRSPITIDTNLLVSYAYDALRRIKSIVNIEGTETYSYDQWAKTITDRLSNTKDFTSDAFGNLVQVDEHNDASTYTTTYTYDTLNNLTKITDALSNIRNFTYDGLSRLTNSEDLHDSEDSSFASTTYAYDDSGNISSKLDANNQLTTFTYDDINRVLTENYTGNAGTEVEYGYDWCSKGIGKLCSATTTDSTTNFAYDALGDITSESKEINNTTYTTSFMFDRQGNQTQVGYPDGLMVYFNYNGAGLLEAINLLYSGSTTPITLVEDFDYGPTGKMTYRKFNNNVESTYTYDATELYRLKNIDTLLNN